MDGADTNSKVYKQAFRLVAEDNPRLSFFSKTDSLVLSQLNSDNKAKEAVSVKCFDKFYPDQVYTLQHSKDRPITYKSLTKFLLLTVEHRNLKSLSREILGSLSQTRSAALIYVRDH